MNYFSFHIGDYAAHTRHLLPLEDLAYRRLLDCYYLSERPLPADPEKCARLIGLRENVTEVEAVLKEFFLICSDGWGHERCDKEIANYQQMKEGGRKGAQRRWGKEGDATPIAGAKGGHRPGHSPPNANHEPVTSNQEPKEEIPPSPLPGGVSDSFDGGAPPGDTKPEKPEYPAEFEEWWSAYPRKAGKDAAARAFAKRDPDRATLDLMLAALAKQKQSPDWSKQGGQFIPHPATWLNQGRWKDQPPEVDRMATWSPWKREQALRAYPDGNIPAGYVPMASPAGG